MSTNGITTGEVRPAKPPLTGKKVKIKPAKETPRTGEVEIFDIEKQVIAVTIEGSSPLIVNNFGTKEVQHMEDQRRLTAEDKLKAKKAPRPPVDPKEKFESARILDEHGRDCVEARWLKAALVTASKYPDVGIASTQLRGAVFVLGDLLPIKFDNGKKFDPTDRYPLGYSGKGPLLRRDVVRVGKFPNKQPDLRYRPEYRNWTLAIEIEFEPRLISEAALFHLIRRAGTSVGFCEWRPEKSPAGIYGRFDFKRGDR